MNHESPSSNMLDSRPDPLFAKALFDLLAENCTPAVVRRVERGASALVTLQDQAASQTLLHVLENSGFADALVPESHGGAGLSLAQGFDLFELCGRFVLPLPLAETMLARAWADHHNLPAPAGLVSLDWVDASALLAPQPPGPGNPPDTRAMRAAVIAAQMAGAMQRVLEMTLQFANDRQQFGRPLGKFQAIQHHLAVMAQQVMAARMAAQIGCSTSPPGPLYLPQRLRAGIAKARCGEAAMEVAALAHAIHGAIGFTEAFDLQLYTRRLHVWRQSAGAESYWHKVVGEALLFQHDGLTLDLLRATTDSSFQAL
jgi:acyl-CoA dehydrogenase